MSSDCGDSDESEDEPLLHRKISADRIDQHKAANKATNPLTRFGATSGRKRAKTAGGDSALIVRSMTRLSKRSIAPVFRYFQNSQSITQAQGLSLLLLKPSKSQTLGPRPLQRARDPAQLRSSHLLLSPSAFALRMRTWSTWYVHAVKW
ncbi:hypothetical protein HO173_007116 [Letharia columbiana]|uniref:Uncharacterized protein n=1 Tax=Letharia columbiana TaxID=112416 RepID=A0A8H6L3R5_9LECA|nr:uncharacterized protein HO173_007116 [Letharia columbiana]KAF6234491.1 hypothetical protein HO173_007116 [Letharia columbiana]